MDLSSIMSGLQASLGSASTEVFTHVLASFLGFLVVLFLVLMYSAHKSKNLDWTDVITSKGSNKVSLTKMLQLLGGVTATWMMVFMTLNDKMTVEFFFTYLAYVGAINAWSKFVAVRYGVKLDDKKPATTPPAA